MYTSKHSSATTRQQRHAHTAHEPLSIALPCEQSASVAVFTTEAKRVRAPRSVRMCGERCAHMNTSHTHTHGMYRCGTRCIPCTRRRTHTRPHVHRLAGRHAHWPAARRRHRRGGRSARLAGLVTKESVTSINNQQICFYRTRWTCVADSAPGHRVQCDRCTHACADECSREDRAVRACIVALCTGRQTVHGKCGRLAIRCSRNAR